jgi:hypothetical protein
VTVAKATAPPSKGKSWRRDRISDPIVFIRFLLPTPAANFWRRLD